MEKLPRLLIFRKSRGNTGIIRTLERVIWEGGLDDTADGIFKDFDKVGFDSLAQPDQKVHEDDMENYEFIYENNGQRKTLKWQSGQAISPEFTEFILKLENVFTELGLETAHCKNQEMNLLKQICVKEDEK